MCAFTNVALFVVVVGFVVAILVVGGCFLVFDCWPRLVTGIIIIFPALLLALLVVVLSSI